MRALNLWETILRILVTYGDATRFKSHIHARNAVPIYHEWAHLSNAREAALYGRHTRAVGKPRLKEAISTPSARRDAIASNGRRSNDLVKDRHVLYDIVIDI